MHAKISFHSETTQNITFKEATAPDKMGPITLCLCVHATNRVTVASHYIMIRYNINPHNIIVSQHSSLLSLNRRHNLPRVLTRSELAVVNPLPRARVQPSIRNRHTNTCAHQTALNVPRHIIQPLVIMPIQHALFVLRRKAIQRISHVGAHGRVGVLVERQGAGSVLDEEVHDAYFEVFELGELACDFVRDEVAAS
jgi:hypothetical protein